MTSRLGGTKSGFSFSDFPPQEMTWILKEEYLKGSLFTMKDVVIQIIPMDKPGSYKPQMRKKTGNQCAEVISMDQMRAKKVKKSLVEEI
jgi:hypothetical protein